MAAVLIRQTSGRAVIWVHFLQRALPAMAIVLAAPGIRAMGLGVTRTGTLHGSQGMVSHAPPPVEGEVRTETRITGVFADARVVVEPDG